MVVVISVRAEDRWISRWMIDVGRGEKERGGGFPRAAV